MCKEIPIFFSTDDNYIPYLDVAIASLIDNASKDYNYRIIILNTGLKAENTAQIMTNRCRGFEIEFFDLSQYIENIKNLFKNIYHFSVATYYRLFIASLFKQYDKIVYLDCDIVVLGDISKLYNTPLGDNILGAVADPHVSSTKEFRDYAKIAVGVDPDSYFNAGVLVINLDAFRKNRIEEKFVHLISTYNFDVLDPDQAYLNHLCKDKVYYLSCGWNKIPSPIACEEKKNLVHYALYRKPWQYDDVADGEYFWNYAEKSSFYHQILKNKVSFGEKEKAEKEAAANDIIEHAKVIIASDSTFVKKVVRS